jgi:hypothetical protein
LELEIKPSSPSRISVWLRRLREILSSFWRAVVLFFSRFKSPSQKSIETISEQHNTNNARTESEDKLRRIVTIESYPPPAVGKEQKASEKRKEFREWGQFIFAGGTAVVALLLLCVTVRYVEYAGGQLAELQKTTKQTDRNFDMQVRVARLIHGKPDVRQDSLGAYHEDKTGAFYVSIWFKNIGEQKAENLIRVTKLDFLPMPPSPSQRTFADNEFIDFRPERLPLQPLSKGGKAIDALPNPSRQIYREQYAALEVPGMKVYVWGEIHYKDFTGVGNDPTIFCFYATAKDVLSVKNVSEGGVWSSWDTCN